MDIQVFQFLIGIINPFMDIQVNFKAIVSIPHRYYKSIFMFTSSKAPLWFQFLIGIINL